MKQFSDVDLKVEGELTWRERAGLAEELDESLLPVRWMWWSWGWWMRSLRGGSGATLLRCSQGHRLSPVDLCRSGEATAQDAGYAEHAGAKQRDARGFGGEHIADAEIDCAAH